MSLRCSSAGGWGRRGRSWFVGVVGLGIVGAAWGATMRVPADYPLIQQALDSAVEGDTVLVAPGTYTGRFDTNLGCFGRDLVICSEGGAGSEETRAVQDVVLEEYFALLIPFDAPLGVYELRPGTGRRRKGSGGMLWHEDILYLEAVGIEADAGQYLGWKIEENTVTQ